MKKRNHVLRPALALGLCLAMLGGWIPLGALAEEAQCTCTAPCTAQTGEDSCPVCRVDGALCQAPVQNPAEELPQGDPEEGTAEPAPQPADSQPEAEVAKLLETLPGEVTAENQAQVREILANIDSALAGLPEESRAGLDLRRYEDAKAQLARLEEVPPEQSLEEVPPEQSPAEVPEQPLEEDVPNQAPAGRMKIQIQIRQGDNLVMEVEPTDWVGDIKARLRDSYGIAPGQLKLYFGDTLLEDEKSLQDYAVMRDSVLRLAVSGTFDLGNYPNKDLLFLLDSVTIDGGEALPVDGEIVLEGSGKNITIHLGMSAAVGNLTLEEGSSLIVEREGELTVPPEKTLTNYGQMVVQGMVLNQGEIINWGILEGAIMGKPPVEEVPGEGQQYTLSEDGTTLTITGSGNLPKRWPELTQEEKLAVQNLVVEEGITAIGESDFSEYTNLKQAKLPDTLKKIGDYAFYGCSSLDLDSLPEGVTSIGQCAFFQCTSLSLTKLPAGLGRIPGSAFYQCENLALTALPEGITEIGSNAFSDCSGLRLRKLPQSLEKIQMRAFAHCGGLTQLTIPAGVKRIDYEGFYGCDNLKQVIFQGKQAPALENYIFTGHPTIFIPEGASGYEGLKGVGTMISGPALTALAVEEGKVSFRPEEGACEVRVPAGMGRLTITATAPSGDYAITIGGVEAGESATVEVPQNKTLEISVAGETTTRTYTLTVREDPALGVMLHWDCQGGTPIAPLLRPQNTEIDLSDYRPDKEGCTFRGWYTEESCQNRVEKILLDRPMTLYAGWAENVVKLTLDTSGLEHARAELEKQDITPGERVALTLTPQPGFQFAQPYPTVTLQGTGEVTGPESQENGALVYRIAGVRQDTLVKVAGSARAKTYQVTVKDSFSTQSGEGAYPAGAAVTIRAGTRKGYRFDGWTGPEGLADREAAETTFTMGSEDVTLRANWVKTGVLRFHNTGTSRLEDYVGDQGEVVDLSQFKPTRKGYRFLGWYDSRSLNHRVKEVELTGGVTDVYAKWRSPSGYDPDGDNPKTGDPLLWLALPVLLTSAAALLMVVRKPRRR